MGAIIGILSLIISEVNSCYQFGINELARLPATNADSNDGGKDSVPLELS